MLKDFSVVGEDLKDMQCMRADEYFYVFNYPIPLIQSIQRVLLMSAPRCIVFTLGLWSLMLHEKLQVST